MLAGLFNGFWIGVVGLPSLVVTLAGLIGYRGLAYVLLEDRSIGEFPGLVQRSGPAAAGRAVPAGDDPLLRAWLVLAIIILQYSGFGRYVYVIGNNKDVARYCGRQGARIKIILFIASGTIAALAGILLRRPAGRGARRHRPTVSSSTSSRWCCWAA